MKRENIKYDHTVMLSVPTLKDRGTLHVAAYGELQEEIKF